MTRRARLVISALAASFATIATAAGCSENDAGPAVEDAMYELVVPDAWTWAPRDPLAMSWEPPVEVDSIAGGGSIDPRDVDDDIEPTDLDLGNATRVHTDETGGIWLLTYGTVIHLEDGDINHLYDTGEGPSAVSAIAIAPGGQLVVTNHTSIGSFQPGKDDYEVLRDARSPLRANAIAHQADGTLVVGGYFDKRLIALTTTGDEQDLLDAPAASDSSGGLSAFVTVLTDNRIIVALAESAGLDIQVVADRALRPVLDGTGQPRPPVDITSLAPAPDGRLLVTTPDAIDAVDVDTGESDTLVDLDGAEGTPSAAASGDDLIFLADGRLWRLPDAFD